MKKKLVFLHPFLFALYPVVFLYAKNIHEYSEITILAPIIIVLVFTTLVLLITKLFVKKIEQTAIISSAIIICALSYSRFLEIVNGLSLSKTIPSDVIVYALIVLIVWFIARLVFRYPKNLVPINKMLTVASLVLVLFSFWTIVSFEMQTKRIFTPQEKTVTKTSETNPQTKNSPDIYYFIFDRYAGPKSLKEEYNFDNSAFFTFLTNKGFYLAKDAKTNYPKTFLSLGSSLNMEYLDYLTDQTNGGASPDESLVTPLIRNGKVIQFLKNKGYYIVNIGPKTWTPTSNNPSADRNFIMGNDMYPGADIFTTGFLNTTIVVPLLQKIFQNPLDVSQDQNNNEHRRLIPYQLSVVEEAIAIKSPKFVFVHILFPHDPFVFDKNCNPIPETVVNKNDHVTNYLAQLQCANIKMTRLISDILKKSKIPPVIILQSDEGPFPMKELISQNQSWGTAKDVSLREKFPILNAYYFPSASTAALYQSISPVNSFRVLFNTYFGTDYPLLPDKNYVFQDQENYYKFIDVTERVQ